MLSADAALAHPWNVHVASLPDAKNIPVSSGIVTVDNPFPVEYTQS